MHYVYILHSQKDRKLYTGCTKDLKARLVMHNEGRVISTSNRRPFKLVYYEAFIDQSDAYAREQWLKTGWGRNQIRKILSKTLENLGG